MQFPASAKPRAKRRQLELLDLPLTLQVGQPRVEIERRAAQLVLLEGDQLAEPGHRDLLGQRVEFEDGVAGLHRRAGPLQDADHARVDRARDHLLDLGDNRAGRGDRGLNRADLHSRRPHGGACDRGAKPAESP